MNRKIWKALGIAVCMLALAAPRAMAETNSHYVSNNEQFADAVRTINNESKIGDKNEIVLMENITLGGNYILTNGKTTTIKGKEGENRKISINGSSAGITVTGEGTVLNLGAEGYAEKLTIEGDTKVAFITVSGGATANMYENVTLQNRQQVDQACVVLEENSVFNMHGGVIQNCKGKYGGVSLKNGSRFIMEGGTISECEANAGGGLYADNSTVTIKDGTISGCKAVNGYGGGLYAKNYSTVTIEGGTISGCTTSEAGMGGGLYAYKSTITISRGTIENNKATYGGGVALNSSTINPITNWTVIGNEAYKTKRGNGGIGGGIYLENGSMDVSDGSNRIYNNKADRYGADIFLWNENAKIELPNAANMGAKYHDSGINIDNWYNDNPRYTPSESGAVVEANKLLNGELSLVASYKASPVRIEIDANGGVGGSGSQTVQKGTNVTLEAPTKEGHLFKGWKDEKGNSYPAGEDGKVKITVNENMKLTAVWEARSFTVTYVLLNGETRTETAAYGKTVTLVEEPRTGYTFVGWKDSEKVYHAGETITVTGDMTLTAEWKKLPSAENLPKTGDESPVLLWGAALAVSAAACFMLRRRK
ncbi:MAG: InlB B-repeat-containing protein [Christensenellales bacterium]